MTSGFNTVPGGADRTPNVEGRLSGIDQYLDEFYRTGSLRKSFEELVEDCDLHGRFLYIGQWIAEPEPFEFDPEVVEEILAPDRFDELTNGAAPTSQEFAEWQKRAIEHAFSGDTDWRAAAIFKLEDTRGRVLWGATLHEDQGTVWESFGPYKSEDELLEALQTGGVFRRDS